MAYTGWVVALGAIIATSAAASTQPADTGAPAPAGGPDTRYCMRVEPQTGSRIESIECWTREEWAEGGVDVDHDWAKEGVKVLNG
jgi:hypothetical protein